MPKTTGVDPKKSPANKQKGLKKCTCCHEEKKLVEFYMSKSPLFSIDRRVPICKSCAVEQALNKDGTINEVKFANVLRIMDKPYYKDVVQASADRFLKSHPYVDPEDVVKYGYDIVKDYLGRISMNQYSHKTYDSSERDGFIFGDSIVIPDEKDDVLSTKKDINALNEAKKLELKTRAYKKKKSDSEIVLFDDTTFEVTPEMVQLFGEGYSRLEYKNMYRKYNDMKINYSIQTNLHQEALVTYVRFKVKEELATANGDVEEAKKWYSAAQDAADKAKLTPKQLTQADLQGGINSFSEIFKAVEQAVDVIPILPRFKFRPNDAIDFNIWCYINYARDLQGLPHCEYEDVYKFYDKKKQEYLDQYGDPFGIFEEDTSEKNRENVKKFITLPKDYEDGG